MRLAVVLLLIANVAFYLWVGERNADITQHVIVVKSDVNPEGMLLLGEIPTGESAGKSTKGSALPASRAGDVCYRVGPFKESADWQATTHWMRSNRLAHHAVRSETRAMRVIKVYLGPFASQAAAQPVAQRLRQEGIEHFTSPDKSGKLHISLGYFPQKELAVKFIGHLFGRGIQATSRAEYRALGPFRWIEAAVAATMVPQLVARRWSDKAMAVEIDCR